MFGFSTASDGNECCDRIMAQSNNRIGIELLAQTGMREGKVMKSFCPLRLIIPEVNDT
jgi:hypothetical protein